MTLSDRVRAQVALVEEHVRRENAHDLPGIMATFGAGARYDDEPWGEHHEGSAAVAAYYENLLVSLPDLRIDIRACVASEDGVAICSGASRCCSPTLSPSCGRTPETC